MVNHPNRRLTLKMREMMDRMRRGPILTMAILGSGGRSKSVLTKLIADDLAEICDHPTVVADRAGHMAQAARLTDAGRAALG